MRHWSSSRRRYNAGTVDELDVSQAQSVLEQTEALIPQLEISLRQSNNQLCILLGMPPEELRARLGSGSIPTAPPDVAVGIPAELLSRRPDVRRAERQAAAQSAQIGVAESDFYPHIAINGNFGFAAENFPELFRQSAFMGSIGPTFQWNVLNYGRIMNNVRFQDATFQELVATYQNTVLTAGQQVENGLVTFLRTQQQTNSLTAAAKDAEDAARIAVIQYKAGTTDFTRVTQVQQNLVLAKDSLAQAQGGIASGLIQVYRALGGGWEIRCGGGWPADYGSTLPREAFEPMDAAPSLEPVQTPQPADAPLPLPHDGILNPPETNPRQALRPCPLRRAGT